MGSSGSLPSFVVIGAQKCGTHWLKSNLDEHPSVFVASGEPGYFHDPDRMRELGPDWYRAQFAGASDEVAVGEGTPGYLIWHHRPADIAVRIDEQLPEVRVVAVLRNPVDRVESAFRHFQKWGEIAPDADLMEVVRGVAGSGVLEADPPPEFVRGWGGAQTLITGGWYGRSLEPYAARFGERLLIVFHDDVVEDPQSAYRSVLDHLDVDRRFEPADLGARVFTNARRRRFALRRRDRQLTPADRRELFGFFEEDLVVLEDISRRDLGSWRVR